MPEFMPWKRLPAPLSACWFRGTGLRFAYPALNGQREPGSVGSCRIPLLATVFSGLAMAGQALGTRLLGWRSASWPELLAKGFNRSSDGRVLVFGRRYRETAPAG